ncbi:MAG TPA: hypothetical protein VFB79_04490 [Candidatus Angelobacter sp.]|nr:hypothetical protein [Candidatus Angelobacter sp.]
MRRRFAVITSCLQFAAILILPLTIGCLGRFERPTVPNVVAPPDKTGSYTLENYKTDLTKYDSATADTEKVKLRNKMVYGIIAEIDYVFYDYETKLYLNQGAFKVGGDFLELGLSSASTITNGARAKTVLSGILSGVSGVDLSIDKNFFRQQTVQAIASSMEANRDRIKTIMLQQVKQDSTVYPFSAARADLIRYFFAGTLPSGLQQLHQQAAASAQTQQNNLNKTQLAGITTGDVDCVTGVNQAVAAAKQKGNYAAILKFLDAMGHPIDKNLPQDKIEESIDIAVRQLGVGIVADPALRKKYCDEAKTAQLIESTQQSKEPPR